MSFADIWLIYLTKPTDKQARRWGHYIDGLVQDHNISIANALEIL